MERLVGQTLDRYKMTQLLGEGGMGAVFKARDVTLQRDVAIKIMHPHLGNQPSFRDRFLQEARTAARLDHPNIVQIYDFGQEGTLLYIVMKFIPGANLQDILIDMKAKHKWIPLDEAVQLVRQICLALDYAHRQSVLHRDLKPSNVMIEPDPTNGLPYRPVLTDLGLARLMEGERITQAGTSMGTPTYMSPEQALGQDTDARSDVYSMGVMLYELATGKPPFPVKTLTEAIRYHTKEIPESPATVRPDLPPELTTIILRALEKDREQRWPTAGALAQALEKVSLAATQVASTPTAIATSVGLMTQYQQSLVEPRGPSILKEFQTPPGTQDSIQYVMPDRSTKTVEFRGRSLTIGRTEENDLVLNTAKVSRQHARIEFDGQAYRVTDLESTNGTYLGSAKLLPGVPEVWGPEQALRVGDVWLRLVRGGAPVASVAAMPSAGMPGAAAGPARPSVSAARVGVALDNAQLSVVPGNSVSANVLLLNQGAVVDHYRVTVDGVPAEWVTLPPVVQLMPGQQQQTTLMIHPPRAPQSRAGRYPVTIRVLSEDSPTQQAEARCTLTVAPFSQFSSEIYPQKLNAGKVTQVTVHNQGNSPETFAISGKDRADELLFEPAQLQIPIQSGATGGAQLKIGTKTRRVLGRPQAHPFTLQVGPTGATPQSLAGELTSKPIIPAWLPPVAIAMVLLLCGLLAMLLMRPPAIELAEVVPPNPIAGQPVTIRWRVTNARRIELRPLGIEVNADVGEYTFQQGFADTTAITLVAKNMLRDVKEPLTIPITVSVEDPVLEEWSVFPTEITQGQEVTIKWRVSNAEDVVLRPFGTVDVSGEMQDRPQQSKTYTIVATNQGRTVERSQEVLVATPQPDAPVVKAFAASPTTAVEGMDGTIKLTWETEKTDTVTIEPGIGPVGLAGSRDVPAPAANTVYTLVAKGPGGETAAQVQVYVEPQQCLVSSNTLNLRSGPGTVYEPPLAELSRGTQVKPLSYQPSGFPDGEWVEVQVVGTGQVGWVNRQYLTGCNRDVTTLPPGTIPPTPMPAFAVSGVTASVDPTSWSSACPKEFTFSAQITVNGPGTVEYIWERSDPGASAGSQSLTFASAGTQTVNSTWQLSEEGTFWKQLHIISPQDITSNQAQFTLSCNNDIVYIYSDQGTTNALGFIDLIESGNYPAVTLVKMSGVLATDFTKYDMVIIGPETGQYANWGDAAGTQAAHVNSAGKPILGLADGGAAFFEKLGLQVGYNHTMFATSTGLYVMDPDHAIWDSPNAISIPASRVLTLYSSNVSALSVYYPSAISGVTTYGRATAYDTHYPLIRQDRYTLWGFPGGVSTMTATGKQVFENTVKSMFPRLLILNPGIIQPINPGIIQPINP